MLLLFATGEESLELLSSDPTIELPSRSFIDPHKSMFMLDTAREGMNRSEAPMSRLVRRGGFGRNEERELVLPSSRGEGKKCCRTDIREGLELEFGVIGVTIGVGRKMEASLVIPGGGRRVAVAEACEELEDGGSAAGVLGRLVEIARRFAYLRSNRAREGEGIDIRTDLLDRSVEGLSDR